MRKKTPQGPVHTLIFQKGKRFKIHSRNLPQTGSRQQNFLFTPQSFNTVVVAKVNIKQLYCSINCLISINGPRVSKMTLALSLALRVLGNFVERPLLSHFECRLDNQ